MTLREAFELALRHHRAGRLADAEALYRQILAVQPNHSDALHLLGLIAHQAGRHELAIEWIRRAIALNPNNHAAHSNLGEAYRSLGRPEEAMAEYRRALELRPDYPEANNNLGNELRKRGQIDEAITAFRRALQIKPGQSEFHANLGNALWERGRLDDAIAAFRHALDLKPGQPEIHIMLGNALRERGQLDEAVSAFRRALQIKPDFPEAHNNLGDALRELGQFDEAVAACRRALELKPGLPEAEVNLGSAWAALGQLDEAIAAFRRALQIKPDFPEACNNLGDALRERGQFDEAVAACRQALELRPRFPEAHNNLGLALRERGQFDEAMAAYRRALELQPHFPRVHVNLGNAFREQGQLDKAVAEFRRALQIKPDLPEAHSNLGNALRELGHLDEAAAACRRAIELKPDFPEAHNNLGLALREQAQSGEAIAEFRQSLQIRPENAWVHSNLIFALHFHPGHDARTISEEHQRWERQFSDPLKPLFQPHANDRAPERKLRVGYVSPDFRDHAVGRYVLPLLECHDRDQFEILCYSGVARPDWMTERLRALAGSASAASPPGGWRNTVAVPDARLAEMIREDGVDILVDLTMHTARNRLLTFARQPAPVQVAWLAYPGSTGLHSIGYRLTDARMDPPGEESEWPAEKPVRLPDSWCCYRPVGESPEINALPALSARSMTFGSLNSFAKVHEGVLARWARVLEAVKGSRLLMLCPEGGSRERIRAFFSARGIAPDRLELVGYVPRSEYLSLYHRIDLGLDPFPFNGMTTSCDALWMGVPVLTLPGAMPASRAGLSLLSSIGLPEFAASSEEDYVRIALEQSENLPRLATLRATLRPRMQDSPLMDAPRFAQNIEAAYRSMWEAWRKG